MTMAAELRMVRFGWPCYLLILPLHVTRAQHQIRSDMELLSWQRE
jgi:hypothetical protein